MTSDSHPVYFPTAAAYKNGDFVCIETTSGCGATLRDPKGMQHQLPPDATDEVLGLAVIDALTHSRQMSWMEMESLMWGPGGTGNQRYEKWVKDLMLRYAYKTGRVMFKNLDNCCIESRDGRITFKPMIHCKSEAWQREKDDGIEDVVVSADSAPRELGKALRLAFSRCVSSV